MSGVPKQKKPRGTARVAFIAHLPTITAELDQGYTAKVVYGHLHAKLAHLISYTQFNRYIRKLRAPSSPLIASRRSASQPPSASPPPAAEPSPQGTTNAPGSEPRKFNFNPNEKPGDRDRLG